MVEEGRDTKDLLALAEVLAEPGATDRQIELQQPRVGEHRVHAWTPKAQATQSGRLSSGLSSRVAWSAS